MYKQIIGCRICNKIEFTPIIKLGNQFVIDFVKERDDNALRAPLDLIKCNHCHLVQLQHSVDPDRLYKKFWYRSGISEAMKDAMRHLANSAYRSVSVEPGDTVLDIGANDGTLLGFYPDSLTRIGCDPCGELLEEGSAFGRIDIAIKGYFSRDAVHVGAPYKIITSAAMFYDVDDPLRFLQDCAAVLHSQGVLVIQMNYLKAMIDNTTFDNICHEHVAYYSFTVLEELVKQAGLEVQGAETNSVNGGSFRVYITHPGVSLYGYDTRKSVLVHTQALSLKHHETLDGYDTDAPYRRFLNNTANVIGLLKHYLLAKDALYLCGASTRGATILQALNLPEGLVRGAAERDEKKHGLYTVGTWVPIFSEDYCRARAESFLLLPYHFVETIRRREQLWLAEEGHELIVPLPEPYRITSEGDMKLGSELDANLFQKSEG